MRLRVTWHVTQEVTRPERTISDLEVRDISGPRQSDVESLQSVSPRYPLIRAARTLGVPLGLASYSNCSSGPAVASPLWSLRMAA